MAKTYLSQFLGIMNDNEVLMTRMYAGLAASITHDVLRAGDEDGAIDISKIYPLQLDAGRAVQRTFIGAPLDGDGVPLQVLDNGQVFPRSAYTRALYGAMRQAVTIAVDKNFAIMDRHLTPRSKAMIEQATQSMSEPVAELRVPPAYDAPHTWVDPAGYRLSDRVWRTSATTRRQIDGLLADGIQQGKSATRISKDLERFLNPRQGLKTRRPYGSNGSYSGMRLARTEISRAHAQASELAALQNPFVQGLKVVLSRSHPKTDICDTAAAAGVFPKDKIPARYRIPLHPHCLCHYESVLVENPELWATTVERQIEREIGGFGRPVTTRPSITRLVTPYSRKLFTNFLMTGVIGEEIGRAFEL